MRSPQRVSAFVASQVSRREFLRRISTVALGVAIAVPTLGRNRRAFDPTTFQRIPSDAPRVLSEAEVVERGLPLYLPGNKLQGGPDCPCDCSWGCTWVQFGMCWQICGTCGPQLFDRIGCHWDRCLDCCDDVCDERCTDTSCSCYVCA
jgi:hypothetical protein